jgi:hypothetical protein
MPLSILAIIHRAVCCRRRRAGFAILVMSIGGALGAPKRRQRPVTSTDLAAFVGHLAGLPVRQLIVQGGAVLVIAASHVRVMLVSALAIVVLAIDPEPLTMPLGIRAAALCWRRRRALFAIVMVAIRGALGTPKRLQGLLAGTDGAAFVDSFAGLPVRRQIGEGHLLKHVSDPRRGIAVGQARRGMHAGARLGLQDEVARLDRVRPPLPVDAPSRALLQAPGDDLTEQLGRPTADRGAEGGERGLARGIELDAQLGGMTS